jgi:hypothetical protein
MTLALAVLSAAAALSGLPQLPERGLALDTKAGVQLQTLTGRRLADLPGLNLATDQKVAHRLVLRDRRGRILVLDRAARRLRTRPFERGCRHTDFELLVCPRRISDVFTLVAQAPRGIGHWVWAERSPDRKAVLAQWSAECEVPVAYIAVHGRLRALGDETTALGWLASGEALVHFERGVCGAQARRGIYAVPVRGKPRLIFRTTRFAQYAMWGG